MNNIELAEEIIKEKLFVDPTTDVFPITLVKYLLNKDKILSFFNKILESEIHNDTNYIDADASKCDACINNPRGILCRKHTSIKRVIETNKACYDEDHDVFLYMNEIYKRIDQKLCVVYAPHTKLIQGPITKYKIKKISSLVTIVDQKFSKCNIFKFKSSDISKLNIKCWFNDEFSLISDQEKNNDVYLVPNK